MDPKHITRTSFCNKEVDNVTDNSMKKYILDTFAAALEKYKLISNNKNDLNIKRYQAINEFNSIKTQLEQIKDINQNELSVIYFRRAI